MYLKEFLEQFGDKKIKLFVDMDGVVADYIFGSAKDYDPRGNHVGPHGQSRGPPGEITWAPWGNHVGPQGKSRGTPGEITWASGNNTEVQVFAKPVVGFIPTGNELVVPGSDVARGKNIETNSLVAKGKIEGWGGVCRVFDIVPDDPAAIRATVLEAARTCDIVVLNAGSSKGNDDWNIEMLEEVGTVLYHETTHGPGHHSSGSVVEGTPVVGISGPPGGAAFTMDFYLYPVMMRWFGLPAELDKRQVRLGKMFPKSGPNPSAGKKPGEDAGKGEMRPTIVTEGKEFFGVKQLQFYQEEDSAELWAMPASSTHAKPAEADTMDCYYMLSSARPAPLYGEILEVDVRP